MRKINRQENGKKLAREEKEERRERPWVTHTHTEGLLEEHVILFRIDMKGQCPWKHSKSFHIETYPLTQPG